MFSSIGLRLLAAMMLLVLGCGLLVGTTGYLESAKIVERQFHQELENTSALISSNIQNKLTLAAQKVEVLAKKRFIQDTSKRLVSCLNLLPAKYHSSALKAIRRQPVRGLLLLEALSYQASTKDLKERLISMLDMEPFA